MDRRDFIRTSSLLAGVLCTAGWADAFAAGTKNRLVGSKWAGWKKGHFQVHFIYTGVGECMFMIFPDGTSMLLDCGDHDAIGRGPLAVPVLPDCARHSGEWIARYVQRVNPSGNHVDYMMLSHYHSDHAGCRAFSAGSEVRDGEEYHFSGFSQAAEYLHFDKAIDRAWPDYDDPRPLPEQSDGVVGHMKGFYRYQSEHNGLQVEKFRLGASDQVVQLKDPGSFKSFSVRNICGNGRLCSEGGEIIDLYSDRLRKHPDAWLNENGMSLGYIFTYGDFKFFTAGDFSDEWNEDDGTLFKTEDALAAVCPEVNVAKINHHGYRSMTPALLSALRARVYVSCVWDQLHNLPEVMSMVSDRSIYPGDRLICPGIMPEERRNADAGSPWLDDVAPESFEGGHVVLDVERGGKRYSITYLTAKDESMAVRSVMHFKA